MPIEDTFMPFCWFSYMNPQCAGVWKVQLALHEALLIWEILNIPRRVNKGVIRPGTKRLFQRADLPQATWFTQNVSEKQPCEEDV